MYHVDLKICLIQIPEWMSAAISAYPIPAGFRADVLSMESAPDNISGFNLFFVRSSDSAFIQNILDQMEHRSFMVVLGSVEDLIMAGIDPNHPHIEDIWPLQMSPRQLDSCLYRLYLRLKKTADFWLDRQYFNALLESTPSMIWAKNTQGEHILLNSAFCRIVGKEHDDAIGKDHNYIWNVADGQAEGKDCSASDWEVMKTLKTVVNEEEVQAGDTTKILTTYKSPLFDFDGSIMGTVGIGIDITQERTYENQIIQNNKDLETIFSSFDCGILCHTIDCAEILKCSQKALQILDYNSMEELYADHTHGVSNSVIEEDRINLFHAIEECQKTRETCSVEFRSGTGMGLCVISWAPSSWSNRKDDPLSTASCWMLPSKSGRKKRMSGSITS